MVPDGFWKKPAKREKHRRIWSADENILAQLSTASDRRRCLALGFTLGFSVATLVIVIISAVLG